MEAASSFTMTNNTGPMNNYKLSGHAHCFKLTFSRFYEKVNLFKKLSSLHCLTFELKGRPLIIIMRPTASLTRF